MVKMENTPENKAKFFSLYFEQFIMNEQGRRGISISNVSAIGHMTTRFKEAWIELISLNDITIEEAQFIVRNEGFNPDWGCRDTVKAIFLKYKFSNSLKTSSIDYLRSKGYALDWMGCRFEVFIEFGWVKIKEA